MHHHGYVWLGSGHDLNKDGPRRPAHPDFGSTTVVPLEVAHWLLKPPSFIRGTWTAPAAAVAWFERQVREHAPSFTSGHERDRSAGVIGTAAETAAGGRDVVGGWYLAGQRFLSVCLVTCSPNRTRPDIPCPTGLRLGPAAAG
ncbi:hypothetical protein IHE55_11675 [Streptomyces pactum]|uniref:Uncharacterized protein n=1 Tax=Streptomyces pactum TaxID=68249 RepID=A0ABS0NJQ6_9ACTN|nr:hypothetical protein [Streptomyces pactum]MBH5335422.1 hypothetical protein [Streptomyces pactum]